MRKTLMTIVLFLSVASTAAAESGQVTKSVNFRSAPTTSSSTYGYLKTGTTFDVLQVVNKYWIKVLANGKEGYVSTGYVTFTAPDPEPTPAPSPAEPVNVISEKVIAEGEKLLGTPYKFGGSGPSYFDCSGFVQNVYANVGIKLPHNSSKQSEYGVYIARGQLQVGDLIFFKSSATTTSTKITHVAIYAGNNRLLHTYGAGGVRYTEFDGTNWGKRYVTSRRVIQ